MATNPYPTPPISKGMIQLTDYATHASVKAVYASENGATSSVITLTPDTTTVEIATLGTGAVMRWVRVAETAASVVSAAGGNLAHVIPANTVRKFAVPVEVMYQAPSSMVGANIQNGLYRRVAFKTIGIASVFLTEY